MNDIEQDDDPDSGPYCRHWHEPWSCEETCVACGHQCRDHYGECDVAMCTCAEWVDPLIRYP